MILAAARLGRSPPAAGRSLLDAISAAVIGGTSLFGRGRVISALLGALVISIVANGSDLLGYSSAIKYMVTGLILLAAVTLDAFTPAPRALGALKDLRSTARRRRSRRADNRVSNLSGR